MTLKRIFAAAAVLLLWGTAYAQSDSLDRKEFGREKVASSRSTSTPYADTLDTGNPEVKIILFQNHTWRYVKDPDLVTRKKVFTEHWTPNVTNPYRISEETLPESFTIWVVDTLDSYCCRSEERRVGKEC